MDKKGADRLMWEQIILIVIGAAVLGLLIFYGPGLYHKLFKGAGGAVCQGLGDYNNNGIPDKIDPCKCDPRGQATYTEVDIQAFPEKADCAGYKYLCDTTTGDCLPVTRVLDTQAALCGQRPDPDTGSPGDAKLKVGHMKKGKDGDVLPVCAISDVECKKMIEQKCAEEDKKT